LKKQEGKLREKMVEIKLYGKYSFEGLKVNDPGLQRYINLKPVYVPKTGGRWAKNRFHKSEKYNIVERLVNKVLCPGHRGKKHIITSGYYISGQSQNAHKIVEKAFDIIYEKTKKNPIEVFLRALENAATREEIIAIEYGGARYPKAVECSPQRRIDITLRYFTQAAYKNSFRSKRSAEQALADELINAYNLSNQSAAIAKKLELERQADSSR